MEESRRKALFLREVKRGRQQADLEPPADVISYRLHREGKPKPAAACACRRRAATLWPSQSKWGRVAGTTGPVAAGCQRHAHPEARTAWTGQNPFQTTTGSRPATC